jgi:hypothetical protein
MFTTSKKTNKQTGQRQGLVPLTPEVAREIEKQLDKHAKTLENLKAHYKAGSAAMDTQHRSSTTQV